MRRLLSPFVLALTAILAGFYAYLCWRLDSGVLLRVLVALPLVCIWAVPAIYWAHGKEEHTRFDDFVHGASYVSMGWLNFAVLLTLLRDLALWIAPARSGLHELLLRDGAALVLGGSVLALALGMLWALRGPAVVPVQVRVPGLDARLAGLRIVQISDLHVGPTIGLRFVRSVVARAAALKPDFYALTGDFVDGPVERLGPQLAPFAELPRVAPCFFVTGNHEYYSGARGWLVRVRELGITVLENSHVVMERNGAAVLVGGVNDPAAGRFNPAAGPRPELAQGHGIDAALRVLLAHNPRLAPLAARAGFDLMLSGHTHGGQFFPWTLAVKWVHAPHVTGLSREDRMQVYVSAGTGSWGPPVRFGTRTEITLLTIVPA